MAEFRINISGLADGTHEYEFESAPAAIGLEEGYVGLVTAQAHLEKSKRQLVLRVEAQVTMKLLCDRCLREFEQRLTTSYIMLYVPNDRSMTDVEEDIEVHVLAPDDNYIELDDDVRQYLVLAVPQKVLCNESCKGLCPVCGVNKNETSCHCEVEEIDPRWDALRKFFGN